MLELLGWVLEIALVAGFVLGVLLGMRYIAVFTVSAAWRRGANRRAAAEHVLAAEPTPPRLEIDTLDKSRPVAIEAFAAAAPAESQSPPTRSTQDREARDVERKQASAEAASVALLADEDRRRFAFQLTYIQRSLPIRIISVFHVALTDNVWTTLNLSPEERAIVDACPTRPEGFLVEQWGEDFKRWRVHHRRNGERIVSFRDMYSESLQYEPGLEIPLWEVELSRGPWVSKASIKLSWDHDRVYLGAAGGRFGSAPSLYEKEPRDEHKVFDLPLPLHGRVLEGEELALRRFIRPSDPPDPELPRYNRRPGLDVYQCEDEERGFSWALLRYDMRPLLLGRVTRVDAGGAGANFIVCDRDTGLAFETNSFHVEPTDDGRTIPRAGEIVNIVLNEEFEIDRVWLEMA